MMFWYLIDESREFTIEFLNNSSTTKSSETFVGIAAENGRR